ncbi:hypothetical protein LshimejAT787_0403920 [Lyophyllum shimeji]|uniref:Uncharacterized protein n=1 Tax=Lyophyllum shimeji TaxID=47721 RepID=A0A9P3PKF0_LYOSH|nr:hypothetical protein LshimejAT787_0403920 [Lyophyllum shimeji]
MAFQSHAKRTLSRDSDFPRTFSWSTSAETIDGPELYAHSIASDILKFDDLEIVPDTPSMFPAVLDRTTLDVGFDYSCLDGLEHQLLFFPADAFAAMCWREAVEDPSGPAPDHSLLSMPSMMGEHWLDRSSTPSDESETDTEECRTFSDDAIAPFIMRSSGGTFDAHPTKPLSIETKSPFTSLDAGDHCITFEPRFAHFNPAESIGLFPVPNPRLKIKTTAIATLRTYLPLGRKKTSRTT